ncbi:BrnA antitoxin family protein [Mesorhizobium sp. M0088]|uniref:BrnA antitoxin family protein n=1 Tax=Mesorhizobium sp. M0088 TaxID=2956873 RepID=UPI003337FC43
MRIHSLSDPHPIVVVRVEAVFPAPNRPAYFLARTVPAVIAKFKATGDGWQARMNDVLAQAKL